MKLSNVALGWDWTKNAMALMHESLIRALQGHDARQLMTRCELVPGAGRMKVEHRPFIPALIKPNRE